MYTLTVKAGSLALIALGIVLVGCSQAPVATTTDVQATDPARATEQTRVALNSDSVAAPKSAPTPAVKIPGAEDPVAKPPTAPPKPISPKVAETLKKPWAGEPNAIHVTPYPDDPPPQHKGPMKNEAIDTFKKITGDDKHPETKIVVAPSLSGNWRLSAMTPAQLAAAVEQKIGGQKAISGEINNTVEFGGGHGAMICYLALLDAGTYKVQYPVLVSKPSPTFQRYTLMASGGKYAIVDSVEAPRGIRPLAELKNLESGSVNDWSVNFGRDLFTIPAGGHPLAHLVALAQKPDSDLVVTVEEQNVAARGTVFPQKRLLITRKPSAVARKGALSIEVVVDADRMLPITVRSSIEPPKATPTRMFWTIRWNLRPDQVFGKGVFDIPATKVAETPTDGKKA